MKKMIFAVMALFSVICVFAQSPTLDPIELSTNSGELRIEFKKNAVIPVVPGTSETFVLQKYAKVFVGEQILDDIEIDEDWENGFSLKGTFPRNWDGKTPVSMTVSLNTNYRIALRRARWNYNGSDIRFIEVRNAAVVRFQKELITVAEPKNGTKKHSVNLTLSNSLEEDLTINVQPYYSDSFYVTPGTDPYAKGVDSAYVTFKAGSKIAKYEFELADNKIVNPNSGFGLELFIEDADSIRAVYDANFDNDEMYIIVKDLSASSVEVNFGTINSEIVKYGERVAVPLTLKGITQDFFDRDASVLVEINIGGTAEYEVDYQMNGISNDGKAYYKEMYALTDTMYIIYKPNTVSTARKDKTIQLQIKTVMVNYFNKGKVGTEKKAEFTIENVLPRIVGVVPYAEGSGEVVFPAPANVQFIDVENVGNTITVYPDSFTTEYFAYGTGYTAEGTYTGKITVINAMIESAAQVKLYYGYQVAAGTEVSFNINGGNESFETAPKIFASAFDPIKDPLENGKAKKITTKAVTRIVPDVAIKEYTVTFPKTPMLYNKKVLSSGHKNGKYFADIAKDTAAVLQVSGAGMEIILNWKQSKPGFEQFAEYENENVATVIAVPPTISGFSIDDVDVDSAILVKNSDSVITISGQFFGFKPKVMVEYKSGTVVKTAMLKTVKGSAIMNPKTSESEVTVEMPKDNDFTKFGSEKLYLMIDSGSGIAVREISIKK